MMTYLWVSEGEEGGGGDKNDRAEKIEKYPVVKRRDLVEFYQFNNIMCALLE